MGVPLPNGFKSPEEWEKHVQSTQPSGYEHEVEAILAYQDGQGRADTVAAVNQSFPKTGPSMRPVGFALIERACETKALVYDGAPEFGIVDAVTREPVADTRAGTAFADVLADAGLHDVLKRVDERTVAARLAFVRPSWDDVDNRIRLDVFSPADVFPLYHPDRPSLRTAPGVLLELAEVNGEDRYELWTAEVNADGTTRDARNLTLNAKGDDITPAGEPTENPYRGPDGIPDGPGQPVGAYPVLPLVAFGDTAASPWPVPRRSLLDAQRNINVRLTNLGHVAMMSGWGQWIDTKTDENAQDWGGSSERGAEQSRLARAMAAPVGKAVVFGPDAMISVPFGHALRNDAINANLEGLQKDAEALLRATCVSEGLPTKALIESAQVASGLAMIVEQQPLMRYREKRIPTFTRATRDLIDLIRIVWNTHHDEADRFLSPGGVRAVFKPDTFQMARDPREVVEIAAKKQALRLFSDAEVRAEAAGESVDEAQKAIEARDAVDLPREALRRQGRVVVAPSPLEQARGAVVPPVAG